MARGGSVEPDDFTWRQGVWRRAFISEHGSRLITSAAHLCSTNGAPTCPRGTEKCVHTRAVARSARTPESLLRLKVWRKRPRTALQVLQVPHNPPPLSHNPGTLGPRRTRSDTHPRQTPHTHPSSTRSPLGRPAPQPSPRLPQTGAKTPRPPFRPHNPRADARSGTRRLLWTHVVGAVPSPVVGAVAVPPRARPPAARAARSSAVIRPVPRTLPQIL